MAEAKLEILVRAKDEASKELKNINRNVQGMSKQLKIAGAAMLGVGVGITAALGMSLKAAAEEQAGITRLDVAMRNMGISYDAVRGSLEAWIDTQQQKTSIADTAQRDSLASLIRMTGDVAKAQDLLTLSMDVAVGTGRELANATTLIMYAMGGNWGMLERYIPALKTCRDEEEKWMKLREMFAGQAEEYGKTLEGQFKTLMNNIGDLKEAIGSVLIPTVLPLVEITKDFTQDLKDLNPEIMRWGVVGVAANAAALTLTGGLILASSAAKALHLALLPLVGLLSALVVGFAMIGYGLDYIIRQQADYKKEVEEFNDTFRKLAELYPEVAEESLNLTQSLIDEGKATEDQIKWMEQYGEEMRDIIEKRKEAIEVQEQAIKEQNKMNEALARELALRERQAEFLGVIGKLYPKGMTEEQMRLMAPIFEGLETAGGYAAGTVGYYRALGMEEYQHGGVVPMTMPAILHRGETVLPANSPIVIHNYIELDGQIIGEKVTEHITEQVRLQGGL